MGKVMRRYSELTSGYELPAVQVAAVNTAVGAGIHDDAEAAKYGYRGGLVPGSALCGYISRVLSLYFGAAWLSSGTLAVSFAKPVYDGEGTTCRAVVTEHNDHAIEFDVWAENQEGTRCAQGRATFPLIDSLEPPPSPSYIVDPTELTNIPPWPQGQLPLGVPFTPQRIHIDAGVNQEYLDRVGETSPLFERLAHPSLFISQSTRMRVPKPKRPENESADGDAERTPRRKSSPGIHVGSVITNFHPAPVGKVYTLYGTYIDSFSRKDKDFGVSEITVCDESGKAVLQIRNTFIFRLPPKE